MSAQDVSPVAFSAHDAIYKSCTFLPCKKKVHVCEKYKKRCAKLETKRIQEKMFPKEKCYYCIIFQCKEPKLVSTNYEMLYTLLSTTGHALSANRRMKHSRKFYPIVIFWLESEHILKMYHPFE